MVRALAWLVVALAAVGCQGPQGIAQPNPKPVTAQSVTLQPSDVPGMQKCDVSGDVVAVLQDEKSRHSAVYDINATEWAQWKSQGATDAYFAVYGQTAADCATLSASGTGAPRGGLMIGLVVKFQNATVAARNFWRDSTLLGLGPQDIRFIELAKGTTTFGSATGLGPDSVIGSGMVAGTSYYVAMWQNKSFESDFMGYDVALADADKAVKNMNRRIL